MWPYFIHKQERLKQFTNLINQELELDYCSPSVVLAIAFHSGTAKAVISSIKEFAVCGGFLQKLVNYITDSGIVQWPDIQYLLLSEVGV